MINVELLNKYVISKMNYKNSICVKNYKIVGNYIFIDFGILGETIKKDDYLNWIQSNRNAKINTILDNV